MLISVDDNQSFFFIIIFKEGFQGKLKFSGTYIGNSINREMWFFFLFLILKTLQ